MSNTTQQDKAEAQWHQYCAAKEQAKREYEALHSKEASRNLFLMFSAVLGLPALLLALELPVLLSILGAPVAFFACMAFEKKSAELRDAEMKFQNFDSFEQWENKSSSAQSEQENEYPAIHKIIQSPTLKKSTEKLTPKVDNSSSLHAPVKLTIQEEEEPSRLIVPRLDASDFDFKISLAANILSDVYRNIEDGKPLRPREKLKLLISETTKLKTAKLIYLDRIFELTTNIYEIKLLFDPFRDQPVWDRLQLVGDLLSEIADSNFKTTTTVADAEALDVINKPKLAEIKTNLPKADKKSTRENMPIGEAKIKDSKNKLPMSTSNCPACKISFTTEEVTEHHDLGIRCPHCRQLMSRN